MADIFGSGANEFEIEFAAIGNPGNPADTTGSPNPVGSVGYEYRMGKYEISEQMIDKANALGGLGITKNTRSPNSPATSLSWFEAAKFVNWLNTSVGSTAAYKFDGSGNFQMWEAGDVGFNPANAYRNTAAQYFLPSVDEWHKAAFYHPTNGVYYDYATGSNTAPTPVPGGTSPGTAVYNQPFGASDPATVMNAGGLSPYGTMAQNGNIWEWEETSLDLLNSSPNADRGIRGGSWPAGANSMIASDRNFDGPFVEGQFTGLRVASANPVPEPSTIVLVGVAVAGLAVARFRRSKQLTA